MSGFNTLLIKSNLNWFDDDGNLCWGDKRIPEDVKEHKEAWEKFYRNERLKEENKKSNK